MKKRLLFFGVLTALIGAALGLQAHKAPARAPLANFDQRKLSAPAAALPSPAALNAQGNLASRVTGLRLQRDARLGTPRFVAAQRGFLTGPAGSGLGLSPQSLNAIPGGEPHRLVKAFVNEHAAVFGHDAEALRQATVKLDATSKHNGLRSVIWQQQLDGIPVYGGLFVSHQTRQEQLVSVSDRFVPDLTGAGRRVTGRTQLVANPPLSPIAALRCAAQDLGELDPAIGVTRTTEPAGAIQRQSFHGPRLVGPAHAQLVWLPMDASEVRLCWQLILTSRVRPEMYLTLVDARSGEILLRRCLTDYISDATYRVYTSDSPSPFSPGLNTPSNFQPPVVPRALVTLPALNTLASPNGWIDDGENETVGNNVDAHLDRNDDDFPDLPRPQGNPDRVFDFPLDLSGSPFAYANAAVVNLFYWNNFCHDKLYEFGFTEEFGNFQTDNFGRGGVGNDAVQADCQDGGGFNNANFSSPPDGFPGRMQMYLFDGSDPDRDGSLDAEVMIHEYVHGLSNRLVGGGAGISELQTRGMGEGWSDFYALALLSEPSDDPDAAYALGGYVTYKFYGLEENYYFGIRRYPYTTDLAKHPLTLKDIDPSQADPHPSVPVSPLYGGTPADDIYNLGSLWCVTLWEARANLIESLGPTAGNNLILQLVTDGMKLSPPNATFLEARDGILLADEILTGGENLAALWIAFAKRGMGYSAFVPASDTTIGVVEAFDLPDFVNLGPPDGILEVRLFPPTGTAFFANTTNAIAVRVTDSASVTNATISATLSTGGSLTFLNNGVDPDLTANNSIYTANYVTPAGTTNVTLTVVVSAPGKDTATNAAVYTIVPVPANDNFTNATKVAAGGGSFVTNNKPATNEPNEPVHAGVLSAIGSLWWSYTPASNGSVLVDTAGSAVNTVLAVYTNNSLVALKPVVSVDDVGTRQQAFAYFNGKAGVTYRIAVTSYDSRNQGTIRLAIVPGGTPDTNAPSVTILSPLSGLTIPTNRILVTGTAIDPDPNSSGLQEIEFRVNPINLSGAIGGLGAGGLRSSFSLVSTNWSREVGLFEGLNEIRVTVRDGAGNQSAPVVLQATSRPLNPVNDIFANAIVLTNLAGTNSVNTIQATKQTGEPVHAGNPGGKSAWWFMQAPQDGILALSTSNSTFDTLLAVYTGNAVNSLTPVAANDDDPVGGVTTSALAAVVRSNQIYRIAVDGFDAAAGAVFLRYQFTPAVVYQVTALAGPGGSVTPAVQNVVGGQNVTLTAVPNAGYVFERWTGDRTDFTNPLVLPVTNNLSLNALFQPVVYTDGFESGGLSGLPWTTAGNAPWVVQNTNVASGSFAARSGVIGASQTTSLMISNNFRAGNGSFSLRVSSEPNWDHLAFLVDGILQQQWSGETDWLSFGFPLTAGNHRLEWRYAKDPNNSAGSDAAFIDNVLLPISIPINSTTPAHLTARRETDGQVYLEVRGQTNQFYEVQASADLTNWVLIASPVLTSGFAYVPDPASLTNNVRFYRAVTPVP